MNPLFLLPLLVAGCVAAPSGSLAIHAPALPVAAALPYAAVQHQVTAHVPAGVELKQVGDVVPVAHAVAPAAVPGYAVQGELRQVTETFPEPAPVAVDVNALPVLGATTYAAAVPAALPAVVPAPLPAAVQVKAVEAPALVAPAVVAPAVAPAAVAYSNLNLNIPAPVPAGEAPSPDVLVQRLPVQALGRPVYTQTPQVTEVRPELQIFEKTYNVAVPKPVYETKEVTPIHHQYVPEPYAVPQPYAVPHPVAVPTPVNVPVAVPQQVHVQHNVVAQPAVAAVGYNAVAAAPALGYNTVAAAPALHVAGAVPTLAGTPYVHGHAVVEA